MKTLQLKQFENRIASLNNCYTHYSLVWDQFQIDHGVLIREEGKKLTTEVFSNNESAHHHDVLLSRLESSHTETQSLILKGIFLLSYGYYEQYLIGLHQFAQALNDTIPDLQQKITADEIDTEQGDAKVINKVLNRLGIPIGSVFSPFEVDTLDYIRLRRNRATHIANTTQGAILEIINAKGTQLNKLWDAQLRNGRNGLDFKRKQIDLFIQVEIIDFLNIFRNSIDKFDEAFIKSVGEPRLIMHYLQEYEVTISEKLKRITLAQRVSKFKNYAKVHYSYSLSEDEIALLKL